MRGPGKGKSNVYRKAAVFTAIGLSIILSSPSRTLAQGPDEPGFRGWGPRVGVTVDPDQIHFGAHVDFGNFADRVRFQPNAELGIGDDITLGALNADVHYRFRAAWDVWTPYAGGGLGLVIWSWDDDVPGRDDSDAELGASLIGGIERGLRDGDRFFIEAKLGLIDAPDLKVQVGWTFF